MSAALDHQVDARGQGDGEFAAGRDVDREALIGIALAMGVVVLFVPAALPWYYTWPLAVASALWQSRSAIAAIAGFSTWIMVIFKPDGSHGMYSWLHVILATGCAVAAW